MVVFNENDGLYVMKYKAISCEKYDYLEIACLYHYELELLLSGDRKITATAETTLTKPDKVEYFIVKMDGELLEIPMTELKTLIVLTSPARFTRVDF